MVSHFRHVPLKEISLGRNPGTQAEEWDANAVDRALWEGRGREGFTDRPPAGAGHKRFSLCALKCKQMSGGEKTDGTEQSSLVLGSL